MTDLGHRHHDLRTAEALDRDRPNRGCLAGMGGFFGIVLLAPMAFMIRTVRGLRRGQRTRFERTDTSFVGGLTRVDLRVDVVSVEVDSFRTNLTDVVVRVGEALRRPDDVYHLLYRDTAADETVVLPVGPQLQELGDRVRLVFSQATLVGRTAVWLTLGRGDRVAELIDPFDYDPEADGEPEGFLSRSGMRWGMATTFASDGVSTLFRIILYIPSESVASVNTVLARLRP